jgi:hypothetical protein
MNMRKWRYPACHKVKLASEPLTSSSNIEEDCGVFFQIAQDFENWIINKESVAIYSMHSATKKKICQNTCDAIELLQPL